MRLISILILALGIAAAPAVWHFSKSYFAPTTSTGSGELLNLVLELNDLQDQIVDLRAKVAALESRSSVQSEAPDTSTRTLTENEGKTDSLADIFAKVVEVGDRRTMNAGLSYATPTFLKGFLGLPSEVLTDDCGEMTNPELKSLLKLENVGPIRVRMLEPAILSLRQIFANVRAFEPELYARISSAGSLCVRRIRGATTPRASLHAYGLAVDINIDGVLDTLGDGKTQLGLTILSDFFRKEGWNWGAAFGREDSMHFEVSREKLEQWRAKGEI